MAGIISAVRKHSKAAEAGIKAGETLCSVNNTKARDIIDLSFLAADNQITLQIKDNKGNIRDVHITKEYDEDLGMEFEEAVFDNVRCCANKCIFCFVDQMIPGMRKTLYVRDDDYRLSFLYGNFITLTNLTDADFERIIKTHLSPLYISVHATDPEIRSEMMKNKFAGELMDKLNKLLDAGISVHVQVVCCPDYNDGKVLEKTFKDLYKLAPMVETMAVVPVGLTKNRAKLHPLRCFTKAEAEKLVTAVSKWQVKCRKEINKTFIYLGDEFYILADKPLPKAEGYDGFEQLENGIGLSRVFLDEWEVLAKKGKTKLSDIPYTILVGESACRILSPLLDQFNKKHKTKHRIIGVKNKFFGDQVNVTGLLTGEDLFNAVDSSENIILPTLVINKDNLFLDDMSLKEFKTKRTGKVELAHDAKELYSIL